MNGLPFIYLDLKKVCEATSFAKSKIYELIKLGEFPEGDLISAQCRRWKSTDIASWLEAQAARANELRDQHQEKLKNKAIASAKASAKKRLEARNAAA